MSTSTELDPEPIAVEPSSVQVQPITAEDLAVVPITKPHVDSNPVLEFAQCTAALDVVKDRHKRSKRKLVEFLEENGTYSFKDVKYEMVDSTVRPGLGMKRCVSFLSEYSDPPAPIITFLEAKLKNMPVKTSKKLKITKL